MWCYFIAVLLYFILKVSIFLQCSFISCWEWHACSAQTDLRCVQSWCYTKRWHLSFLAMSLWEWLGSRYFVCMTFPLLQLIFLKHLHSWQISGFSTEGVNEYWSRLNEVLCLLSEPCNPWEMLEGRRKLSGGNVLHRCQRCSADGTADVLPVLGRSWTMPVCDVSSQDVFCSSSVKPDQDLAPEFSLPKFP